MREKNKKGNNKTQEEIDLEQKSVELWNRVMKRDGLDKLMVEPKEKIEVDEEFWLGKKTN